MGAIIFAIFLYAAIVGGGFLIGWYQKESKIKKRMLDIEFGLPPVKLSWFEKIAGEQKKEDDITREAQRRLLLQKQSSNMVSEMQQETPHKEDAPEPDNQLNEFPIVKQMVTAIHDNNAKILSIVQDNQSADALEIAAIQEVRMKDVDRIVADYIKIASAPSEFNDSAKRLEEARATLDQYRQNLIEDVRNLNENTLHDFKVSLIKLRQTTQN